MILLRRLIQAERCSPQTIQSIFTRALSSEAPKVAKFTISQQHLDTVKATLPLVAQVGTDFTTHFYSRMFKENPSLLNVFNQTNQTLGGQPKKLLKTIAVAAQMAIDTGELPLDAIEGLCQKHVALHVTPEQYSVVGENLLGAISDLLTDDKDVIAAWACLYGDIANVFITREKKIREESESAPNGWSGRRTFVLERKEPISSVTSRFKFRPVDGKPVSAFKPGQYTTIWIKDLNEVGKYGPYNAQPRHYTLAIPRNPDDINKTYSISVKREGLVSKILHNAEEGTEYDLSVPTGCFGLTGVENLWLSELDAPIVLISAGVGITPVLAILESIYVTRPATWLHAAESGGVHAYRDRLREITAIRSGELQRRVWYNKPLSEDGTPGGSETNHHLWNIAKYHYKGLMDLKHSDFDKTCLHLDNDLTQYYMCGPPAFMDVERQALIDLGVDKSRIHWEGFA